jgi:hypothetical protein
MLSELTPFAVLAVVLGLFGLLLRHGVRVKKEVAQFWPRLEHDAASLGYRPAPAEADSVARALRHGASFTDSHVSVLHVLAKQGQGARRCLVQCQSSRRSRGSSADREILYALGLDDRRLPRFVLHHSPVRMPDLALAGLDKLVQIRYSGFERVPLDATSPELANSVMYAENRDAGVRALTADVVEVLGSSAGWAIESTGAWLIADRHEHGRTKAGDPSATVAELAEFDRIAAAFEG